VAGIVDCGVEESALSFFVEVMVFLGGTALFVFTAGFLLPSVEAALTVMKPVLSFELPSAFSRRIGTPQQRRMVRRLF